MGKKKINNYKTFLENKEYDYDESHMHDMDHTQSHEEYNDTREDVLKQEDGKWMDEHCTRFSLQLLRIISNARLWHLQTPSYSEHEALQGFYEALEPLADNIIEVITGLKGPINREYEYRIDLIPYDEMLEEIKAFKEFVQEFEDGIDEDSVENIVDDILTTTDSLIYKLENLS